MPTKYTSDEIIKKINQKHNNTIYVNKDELVDCQTNVEFTCNICGYKWKTKPYSVIAGHGCRRCYDKRNSENRITPLNVLNEKLKHSGCNAQIIGEYIDTKHKALAKCDKCGYEWRTNPNDMLRGHGCPKCNDEWAGRRKTKEQFIKEMNNLYNGEYIYIIDSDYVRTRDIIKFICSVHDEVEQLVETHIKGGGCKFCSESKGEKYIRNFLIENNIKFIPQFKKFDWLKTNKYNSLSFDFYLTDYNIAIEVDNIATIKDLVRKDLGVSVLPKSSCIKELRSGKLAALPIENLSMVRETRIVYGKDFLNKDILQKLTKVYQETMKEFR